MSVLHEIIGSSADNYSTHCIARKFQGIKFHCFVDFVQNFLSSKLVINIGMVALP